MMPATTLPSARILAAAILVLAAASLAGAEFDYPGEHRFVGSAVRGITTGDADGDGHADILVVCSNSFAVHIRYGDGSGGFDSGGASIRPLLPGSGDTVALADVDLDGDLDLVASGFQGVHVMRNAGSRAYIDDIFTEHYTAGSTPDGLAVVDLDGDTFPDIALGNHDTDIVAILVNNGDGTFAAPVNYAVGDGPTFVAAADIDGVNGPDLVVANDLSDNLSVLLNTGAGTFLPAAPYAAGVDPKTVAIADVNGDLFPDLLVANEGSGITIHANTGTGAFLAPTFTAGGASGGLGVGDLDNDGDPDILAAMSNSIAATQLNSGSGGFSVADSGVFGNRAVAVALADFDEDGNLDAVFGSITENSITVFPGDGAGTLAWAQHCPTGPAYGVASGDLNGDGLLDLVAGLDTGFATLENLGGGVYDGAVLYPSTAQAGALAVADLDADADLDVAVCLTFPLHVLQIFRNDGTGALTADPAIAVGSYPEAMAAADLDADGDTDLVIASRSAKTISIFTNNGDATFPAPTVHATTSTPRGVAIGDVDGDADLDIVHNGTTPITVRFNDGAGGFATVTNLTGSAGYDILLGDMDGDGDLDIVSTGSSVSMYLRKNLGAGVFASHTITSLGLENTSASLRDMDDDGDLDLVALLKVHYEAVRIYPNTGTGAVLTSSSTRRQFATGSTPQSADIADLNNDSIPDIAVAASGSNGVNVLLGALPAPPPCPGDVNGDGDTNISDFNILAGNFGASVTPNTGGDLTGDGIVNISDFNILAGDFGCAP